MDVSYETKTPPEASAELEEQAKKNGVALGTISIVIHEESDVRDSRDAAITSVESLLKVIQQMAATEKTLREKLANSSTSFNKERQERTNDGIEAAAERMKLQERIKSLESQHMQLVRTNDEMRARIGEQRKKIERTKRRTKKR